MMGMIFVFSSRPSGELPNFDVFDALIKKSGHMIGYGLLALSYARGLGGKTETRSLLLAWGLALLYAATDEYHQSFVPGRHPAVTDVLIFDNLGAVLGLYTASRPNLPLRHKFLS